MSRRAWASQLRCPRRAPNAFDPAGTVEAMAFFRRKRPTDPTRPVLAPAAEHQPRPPVALVGAETAPDALNRRVRRSAEAQDVRLMLEPMALAEGSAAIDAVNENLEVWPGPDAARVVVDISQLHRIRAMALGGPGEELHAQVALSVLAYVLDADGVAPAIREEAVRGIAVGAETDLPTAMLRAVQGHAYAVRAAAVRDRRDAVLAELFVRSFRRILEVAGSNTTNWSGRVLDLAAAHDHRYRAATPDGDLADLDEGIRLTEQVLKASAADPAAVLRAHKLRAPMLMERDELRPGADLHAAEQSFQAIVDLTPPGHPTLADTKQRLAATQMLLRRRPPQP